MSISPELHPTPHTVEVASCDCGRSQGPPHRLAVRRWPGLLPGGGSENRRGPHPRSTTRGMRQRRGGRGFLLSRAHLAFPLAGSPSSKRSACWQRARGRGGPAAETSTRRPCRPSSPGARPRHRRGPSSPSLRLLPRDGSRHPKRRRDGTGAPPADVASEGAAATVAGQQWRGGGERGLQLPRREAQRGESLPPRSLRAQPKPAMRPWQPSPQALGPPPIRQRSPTPWSRPPGRKPHAAAAIH